VVGVLPGPHADPDFLTPDAMDVFYSSPYEVHYNSNRCGRPGAPSCKGQSCCPGCCWLTDACCESLC
jgi:hypothetical protein